MKIHIPRTLAGLTFFCPIGQWQSSTPLYTPIFIIHVSWVER